MQSWRRAPWTCCRGQKVKAFRLKSEQCVYHKREPVRNGFERFGDRHLRLSTSGFWTISQASRLATTCPVCPRALLACSEESLSRILLAIVGVRMPPVTEQPNLPHAQTQMRPPASDTACGLPRCILCVAWHFSTPPPSQRPFWFPFERIRGVLISVLCVSSPSASNRHERLVFTEAALALQLSVTSYFDLVSPFR